MSIPKKVPDSGGGSFEVLPKNENALISEGSGRDTGSLVSVSTMTWGTVTAGAEDSDVWEVECTSKDSP